MLVSWELLKDFIDIAVSPEEAAERLTLSGAEVEGMTRTAGAMKGVVVARIVKLEEHPQQPDRAGDAQTHRLSVAHLDTGAG